MRHINIVVNDESVYQIEWDGAMRARIRKQASEIKERIFAVSRDLSPSMALDDAQGGINILRDTILDNLDEIRKANRGEEHSLTPEVIGVLGAIAPHLNEHYGITDIKFVREVKDGVSMGMATATNFKGDVVKIMVDAPTTLDS